MRVGGRALPARVAAPSWESLLCAALAATAAVVAMYAPSRGGDLPAHLWRTDLVRHGFVVWDNLWFAGQYPLSSYSLFYYLFAAVVGNAALGIAGVVASAALFSSLLEREWQGVGRWPGRAFAVLLAGQVFTAAYPYDLGIAAMLAALLTLQRRRPWAAGGFTLLTLGFSPLAFVFLMIALGAVFLRRRRLSRPVLIVGAMAGLAAGMQLAALLLLPTGSMVYPYGWWRFLCGIALVACGVALSLRGRAGWTMAAFFLVWGAASIVVYAVPSPVGHNLVRASTFLFPLMLVAAALAGFRPRWLAFPALAGALAANVLPYAPMISQRTSVPDSRPSFWQPIVRYLDRRLGADYRVEVVPTANHWESSYLPSAGIPLARGWYRQLDIADNPALYAPNLTPAGYRAWLRSRGVRFVVLPRIPLEAIDAQREARLVRASAPALKLVWSRPSAQIYRLARPTPLLTGPGRARITRLDSNEIDGWVSRPGVYRLRVNFTPYWSVDRRSMCVTRGGPSSTDLTVRVAGRFSLRAIETPLGVLDANLDGGGRC